MKAHRYHEPEAGDKHKKHSLIEVTDLLTHAVKMLIGALIGTLLTSLFGIVIFAFVIKALTTNDEMSFQLLNSAITVLGTALGAVLGYYLGRKPR